MSYSLLHFKIQSAAVRINQDNKVYLCDENYL